MLAGFIMCPILTVVADTVGMLGGWIVALTQLRVSSGIYWSSVVEGLYIQDVYMGIIKPFFLGIVIVTIGCHVGLRTSGGTPLMAPSELLLTRDIGYSESVALAKEREEALLFRAMESDIADQVMRRLAALPPV